MFVVKLERETVLEQWSLLCVDLMEILKSDKRNDLWKSLKQSQNNLHVENECKNIYLLSY